MTLPPDFDPELWFDPLTFQGIIGRSIAQGCLSLLYRDDGFARPKDDLKSDHRLEGLFDD